MTPTRTFLKLWEELGKPNVYLVAPKQFENAEGDKLEDCYGISSEQRPIITVARGLRGRVLKNTICHEIAHHLWPWRKHWWIEAFAERMADGGGAGYYCKKYRHTADELPPRQELLRLARRASARFNERR